MNPFDNVGTTRISASFYDRLCRLAIGYQSAAEDEQIVALRTGSDDAALVADAVALTRATREHPDVRQGSSVRGAIDIVAVAGSLADLRGPARDGDGDHAGLVLDAALVALSARITLDETSDRTPEEVIRELWEDHFVLRPHRRAAAGVVAARSAQPDMTAGPGASRRRVPGCGRCGAGPSSSTSGPCCTRRPAAARTSSRAAAVTGIAAAGADRAARGDGPQRWMATTEVGRAARSSTRSTETGGDERGGAARWPPPSPAGSACGPGAATG